MGTALVVGLLIVMCGGIAYVGDLLGWRMGKRRLSLFGLRPRHTAVVFTVCTGMLIATVTLGALMLASRGVRIAVTRGEQLLYDNHRLKQERRRLDAAHGQLVAQMATLESANKGLLARSAGLRTEEERLRGEAGRLLLHNQALQTNNHTLGRHNAALVARSAGLLKGNRSLLTRNRSLAAQSRQLSGDNRSLTAANGRLQRSNLALKGRNRGLQVAESGLIQARDRAQAQLTKLQSELISAHSDLNEAQSQLTSAVHILAQQNASSERGHELATGTVVVRAGEELARRVLPAGASTAVVRDTLQGLLDDADREIARRAGQAPGAVRRAALDPAGHAAEEAVERTVAELMTESHPVDGQLPAGPMREIHPLVLHALATQNATAASSDPVTVDVLGQVNQRAFHRGDEVAQLYLNPSASPGQLLERLVGFLQQRVREEAMKRSILPDASGSVGKIDYDTLLDVAARVKRMPGQALVGAVAAGDTWSAGPLRLDFYVVPAPARVAKDHPRE